MRDAKPKYDVILMKDEGKGIIPPYSVYLGTGVSIEIKNYQNKHYIGFKKCQGEDVKNRFNMPIDLLSNLIKGLEKVKEYVQNYTEG